MRKSKMDSEMALWLRELHPLGKGTKLTTQPVVNALEYIKRHPRAWCDLVS